MIVVTGANGFIGNVLVRQLLNEGYEVRALIGPSGDNTPLRGLDVETVKVEISDPNEVHSALKGATAVFHLASKIDIQDRSESDLYKINVLGTENVIKASIKNGVKRLIYTSSVSVLQRPSFGVVLNEDVPIDPSSTLGEYDRTKALATLQVLRAIEEGLDAVILYPSGVVGPFDFKPSLMGQFILDFLKGKIRAYVEGEYNFVDVRDVVKGHIAAWKFGRRGEGYILSGEVFKVSWLLRTIEETTGKRHIMFRIPYRLASFSIPIYNLLHKLMGTKPRFSSYVIKILRCNPLMSYEKAKRELGYNPRPIKESISDTVRWFSTLLTRM